jgi:fatty acid desaturase
MKQSKLEIPKDVVDKARSLRGLRSGIIFVAWMLPITILLLVVTLSKLYGITAAVAWPIAVICAGLLMRAQENLVHELSHRNVFRSALVTDFFGTWVAGAMLMSFTFYRQTHGFHHRHFGSREDPCFNRMHYADTNMGLIAYMREHFHSLAKAGSGAVLVYLAWLALIATIGGGLAVLSYLVAQFVVLPAVRRNAEAAEHDYSKDEFHGTFTNLGLRKLIHPLGDGYHLLHHMFPYVPGTSLGELHRYALVHWPEYAGARSLRSFSHPQSPVANEVITWNT